MRHVKESQVIVDLDNDVSETFLIYFKSRFTFIFKCVENIWVDNLYILKAC